MPDQKPIEEKDLPAKKKKGSPSCLSRICILGLIILALLGGFLAWFNGPGFRWAAHKYGPDLLAKNGFAGDFQISGTLLKGPTIDSIDLTCGTSPLKSLSATNLQLRYNPFDLKDFKIEELTADTLTIDLDLSQSAPSEEPAETAPAETSLSELLAKYHPLATYPKLEIRELNLHVHNGDQNFYRLQQASFSHPAQSNTFSLSPGTITDFEDKTFSPPTAEIVWSGDDFTLTSIPLSKEFSIPNLELQVEPLLLEGQVAAFGSELTLNTDLRSQVTATLGTAPLDLAPFIKLVPSAKGTAAQVTQLEATASKLDQKFSQWAIGLELVLGGCSYQGRDVPETEIAFFKDELELDTTFSFNLPNQQQQLNLLTNLDPKTAQSPSTAWKNSQSDLTTELASLSAFLEGIAPSLNLPVPPDGWPDGETLLLANINIKDGQPAASKSTLTFNRLDWAEAQFEKGELTANYIDNNSDIKANLIIEQSATSTLTSRASFLPSTQAYAATFSAKNFDAQTLQPFIRLSLGNIPLAGNITLDWQGNGALPDNTSHRGKLVLAQTRVSIDKQTPIQLNLAANYQGISRVEVTQFEIQQDDQRLATEALWNGKRIEIPNLSLIKGGQHLVAGKISAPFALNLDFKNYFTIDQPWSVDLNADRLDILGTCDLLGVPPPEGVNGTVTLDVSIAGTPAEPSLGGKLLLEQFTLASAPLLPPTTARLAWATAGQNLTLDGTLEPEGRNPISINGNTSFLPKKWAQNPESFLDEAFNLRATAPNIQLAPFADLSPDIKSLKGNLAIQVNADGTFRTPNLTGDLDLDLPKARFNIDRLRRVRQTKLQAKFSDNKILITPFKTSIDGALFDLTGAIDLANTQNPSFDLRLNADKALLWRDPNVNARADALLFLKGTLEQARLSGEVGIVESLFYKDIELLPVNVPLSTPKAPTLPAIGKRKKTTGGKTKLPIPEPFASWDLDLQARTVDPFLIRGNLTKGEATGALKVAGKLGEPQVEGEFSVGELNAALPFSTLKIESGKAYFNSRTGFIPDLDIRAQSRIPPYEVDLFVSGSATSPDISFSSKPPLPENEVIALVATGTTTEGLEDPEAAAGKAFQLLIEQIRRSPPGSPLHPLARFAEPLKDVELQVGGVDPFTGKRRNSVTLPLPNSNRWFVSASVDSESNTRGLALYIIKFR